MSPPVAHRLIGLGSYPTVSLAQARGAAKTMRTLTEKGIDPKAQAFVAREAALAEARAAKAASGALITFGAAAVRYIAAHERAWTHKHAEQWRKSLEQHAFTLLGEIPVRDIATRHVLDTVKPIWESRTVTANRMRGRIEMILNWAAVHEYRDGTIPNPARWRGHLELMLPAPRKIAPKVHLTALPFAQMASFMTRLRTQAGVGARAVEFAILTVARCGEVRGATWAEIDLEAQLWTIPAARMKAAREHRVALSDATVALLTRLQGRAGLLFPATRGGTLSDMTLSAVLRRMDVPVTVHSFRSTFRDWVAERTTYPGELAELALAHAVGSAVENAYRRGDQFEKRIRLMNDWASFCADPTTTGGVVALPDVVASCPRPHPGGTPNR